MAHRPQRLAWLAEKPAHAAAYLEAALQTGDAGDLMQALRDIADARGGIARLAAETGLNRETLYRTLSKRGNPQLSSLIAILRASGLKLAVEMMQRRRSGDRGSRDSVLLAERVQPKHKRAWHDLVGAA